MLFACECVFNSIRTASIELISKESIEWSRIVLSKALFLIKMVGYTPSSSIHDALQDTKYNTLTRPKRQNFQDYDKRSFEQFDQQILSYHENIFCCCSESQGSVTFALR